MDNNLGTLEKRTVEMSPGEYAAFSLQGKQGKAAKCMMVVDTVMQKVKLVRDNSSGTYYYYDASDQCYKYLSDHMLEKWVTTAYIGIFQSALPKDISDCCNMIKLMTMDEVETTRNGIVKVSEKSFWVAEEGGLTRHLKEGQFCFRKLFDTEYESKHIVKVEPFGWKLDKLMWERYQSTLKELKKGKELERYKFIKTWAAGSHDVYMDIIRSIAYCFIKKKPVGSYVLVGSRRNGKSSFVGLLHTIFGTRNTSMVRLSQLGDPHYSHGFLKTMLNAPDEEDEKATNFQADFKTLADHSTMDLPVMRSNEPRSLLCDFMCFYPMNHIPEWKGSGSAACVQRTLVIPFYADLSQYDRSNFNFAKETFTSEHMADFMGTIFAYAHYYSRHDLEFSDTMLLEQQVIEDENDSALNYFKEFTQYFDGLQTIKLAYNDYCNWCKKNDVRINTRREFKFVFRKFMGHRVTYMPGGRTSPYSITCYRMPEANKQPMIERMKFPELNNHTAPEIHEYGGSVVLELNEYFAAKHLAGEQISLMEGEMEAFK